MKPEFAFEQKIRNAAFAGLFELTRMTSLGIRARYPLDQSSNTERPMCSSRFFFSHSAQTFFDRVLMRTTERRENQFARVRLARRHGHLPVQRS